MIPETTPTSPTESPISPRSIFLYWLPVIAALAVFGQVAVLGLRPALAEDRRLADATQVLVDRYQSAVAESDRLARLLRAQQDPVLLERERREQLVNPRAPGLER
ncbi:MAG TPA: hypothetical protein VK843_01350 [Planctomycetota bacterium]|nr:hypothetical protein [Planctomycetota bacterium]